MLGVTVICVGSIGERFYADACKEYAKRLGAFCKLNVVEIAEERLSQSPPQGEIDAALAREAKKILAAVDRKSVVLPLCVEGKQLSSEELAAKLDGFASAGRSRVTFIIGGSFGLADEIKALGELKLSLSRMTLPHHLARVFLLEQIYRAFQINSGGRYHK